MPETTKVRRTHWQAVANRRYPRMQYIGGDGAPGECWIVLCQCKRSGTHAWCYVLRPTYDAANTTLEAWNKTGCGSDQCGGSTKHKLWKVSE